jgi:O-antigen/teichoic acid export membrane protein
VFRKSFLKIGFVGAGHIINAVLGFVFLTATAKYMSLDDFGKYALLSSILIAMAKLTDLGSNSLFVAKSISLGHTKLTNAFYSLKVILFAVTTLLSIPLLLIFKINDAALILIFIAGLFAYMVNFTFYGLFQKVEDFYNTVFLNTIIAVIKAFFAVLIFTKLMQPTVLNSFAIFSLSVFPSLILGLWLPEEFKKFKFSLVEVGTFFKEAFPAGVSQMITESWSAISNTIANMARGFANVGVFSLADKISNIFALIALSVFTVLLPKNARRKKENLDYDIKETVLISAGLIVMAIGSIIVSHLFLIPIFGEKFSGSLPLLDLMIVASAIIAINTFMENYFFVEQKTNLLMGISLAKLTTFLIPALILVGPFNLLGIAWAQIFSSTITLLIIFSVVGYNFKKARN